MLAAPAGPYVPTALLVLEVRSPDDATWDTFWHYTAHDVGELLVADGTDRSVRAFQLDGSDYLKSDTCVLLDLPKGSRRGCRLALTVTPVSARGLRGLGSRPCESEYPPRSRTTSTGSR